MAESIGERLHVSTVASDAPETAEEFGLGLEIADFCTASNLDGGSAYSERGLRLMGLGRRFALECMSARGSALWLSERGFLA